VTRVGDAEPVPETGSSRREHELALLVDSLRDSAILLLDHDGLITTWNLGAERLNGYTAAEAIGQSFSMFSTDEDRARDHPAELLEIARRKGRADEECWVVRRDGSRFWAGVVITAMAEPDGTILGFGTVVRDLTGRRLAEERLRAGATELETANVELEQFRRLILSVRDYAIFLLDPGGYVTTWNPGAEHAKGYTAEEIVGRHFSAFYTDEDRARDHPAEELRIAAEVGRYEEEGWRIRKDGSRFWASVLLTAVRDPDGTLVGYAKITRDLTERRAAEQAVRDANTRLERTNRELDRFAAVAAHDLQEPLRTIAGFTELLTDRHREGLDPAAQNYLAHIASGVERMTQLVDDLLRARRRAVRRRRRHGGAGRGGRRGLRGAARDRRRARHRRRRRGCRRHARARRGARRRGRAAQPDLQRGEVRRRPGAGGQRASGAGRARRARRRHRQRHRNRSG
jgi:PAS domain S-box-containing protein